MDNFLLSITKIESGTKRGTGFLVKNNLILTCSHNIENTEKIVVTFCSLNGIFDIEYEAVVYSMFGEKFGDIALLSLNSLHPTHSIVPKILIPDYSKGNEFETHGFPNANTQNGQTTGGQIKFVNTPNNYNIPQITLHSNEITYGFSGAPIYDTRLKAVIGIINQALSPDKLFRGLSSSFGVSSNFIAEKCPEVYIESLEMKEIVKNTFNSLSIGQKLTVELKEERAYGYLIRHKGIRGLLHENNYSKHSKEMLNTLNMGEEIDVIVIKKNIDEFNDFHIEVASDLKSSSTIDKLIKNKIIACSKNKQNKQLNLSNLGINFLPKEIGLCLNIEELDLSNNNLFSFPDEIKLLVNLKILKLNNNKFRLIQENQFSSLIKLEKLHLENNQISYLSNFFSNLKSLTYISIFNNPILNIPYDIAGKSSINPKEYSELILKLLNPLPIDNFSVGQQLICIQKIISNSGLTLIYTKQEGSITGVLPKNKIPKEEWKKINKNYRAGKPMNVEVSNILKNPEQLIFKLIDTKQNIHSPADIIKSNFVNDENTISLEEFKKGQILPVKVRLAFNYGMFVRHINSDGLYRDGLLHKSNIPKEIWKLTKKGALLIGFECDLMISAITYNTNTNLQKGGIAFDITDTFVEKVNLFFNKKKE